MTDDKTKQVITETKAETRMRGRPVKASKLDSVEGISTSERIEAEEMESIISAKMKEKRRE